jgi:transcriptional regulator with XRE-family HTH domain
MARPEIPITGAGPVADLARALRRLRDEAGKPDYRALAAKTHYAPATLATAAAGRIRPTWEVTEAFARACGANPAELRPLWGRADKAAKAARASGMLASRHQSLSAELRPAVERLAEVGYYAVEADVVARPLLDAPRPPWNGTAAEFVQQLRRLRAWAGQPGAKEISKLSGVRVPSSTLYDAIGRSRTRLPSLELTTALAAACGASVPDWQDAWKAIRMAEVERDSHLPPAGSAGGPAD